MAAFVATMLRFGSWLSASLFPADTYIWRFWLTARCSDSWFVCTGTDRRRFGTSMLSGWKILVVHWVDVYFARQMYFEGRNVIGDWNRSVGKVYHLFVLWTHLLIPESEFEILVIFYLEMIGISSAFCQCRVMYIIFWNMEAKYLQLWFSTD